MTLVPLARRKRAHDVVEEIERMIASSEFGIGDQLPSEKDLMLRLGVGRPAVREALFILEQQGLVEIANGTRARVIPPSAKSVTRQLSGIIKRLAATPRGQEHVEQARLLLESGLAWQAAQMATDADIVRLKAALGANVAAVGKTAEFIRTDVAFHYELAVITGNPIFTLIQEIVVEWLIDQRTTTIHMPDADSFSVRDHTAIYEAVAARDPARAFHEMVSHLRLISQLYREAKRLSEEVLRGVTHDVAKRIDRERAVMWAAALKSEDKPPAGARRRAPRRPAVIRAAAEGGEE